MDISVLALALALVLAFRVWNLPGRLAALQEELASRKAEQHKLQAELQRLRDQLSELLTAGRPAPPIAVVATPVAPPTAAPVWRPAATEVAPPQLVPVPPAPEFIPTPEPVLPAELAFVAVVEPVAETEPLSELALAVEITPVVEPASTVEPTSEPELVSELAFVPVAALVIEFEPVAEAEPITELESVAEAPPATKAASETAPTATPEETQDEPTPSPVPVAEPELVAEPEPTWVPAPRQALPPTPPPPRKPMLPRRPAPKPVPTGPTWWERASTMLLENWTGILGAIVLVTGVGFLGIYTALRVAPPLRFLMICAFAGGLLGTRYALRAKPFAKKLNAWLVSSAAAIFLFACVGAVSIEGLCWATPPFDYLLLLAGVSANLYLAWRTSREEVATLHGVLSLVALAVLPPTALTLGAAAGVTAFSIAITYRQLWKYQLLLSIASFFAFHLYWHHELAVISNPLRLTAMALVLLVGGAAAVVQYRSVYARRRFEPLLFTAHLLNWTCLGVNLYLYSTGSIWKTIPLALGALLTFWAGRRAKQLGIGWLFQTDTIISLILALVTALSLQGWHATPTIIGLFMLLEALLITLVMARQRETLVYRVALTAAVLASSGVLVLAGTHWAGSHPAQLYREVLVLALAGWAGLAFVQLILKQPLLQIPGSQHASSEFDNLRAINYQSHRSLLNIFAGLTGLLQLGAGLGLARILFGWSSAPVGGLLLGLAGAALALAVWVRRAGRAPSWVRWQQLVLAQFFVLLALLGLHEAGLNWSITLLLLYAENLLVVLLLAGRAENDWLHQHGYRAALAVAALAGLSVLLRAIQYLPGHSATTLYREALVLGLAGWATLAFIQAAFKWPLLAAIKPYLPRLNGEADDHCSPRLVSNHATHFNLLNGFAGLGGGLQATGGIVLGRIIFGVPGVPVAALLGALVALAGISIGLALWVRKASQAPGWVRWQQLVLAQAFALLALLGLHKLGLNWSATLLLVYLETLLVALLLAGRAAHDLLHRQLYRMALAGAALAGLLVLLRACSYLADGVPPVLYREALVLVLAGWASLVFVQVAFKWRLLAGIKPYLPRFADANSALDGFVSNAEEQRDLVSAFAGLGGVLQALAGVALARVVVGWSAQPTAGLLGLLLGLAGISLALAAWVRTAGRAPGWVRWQQLVLAQFFVLLALFGLHEVGLQWSTVLFSVFVENLLVALLLAGRAEYDLLHQRIYRAALAEALLVGTSLLLLVATHMAASGLAILYREALLLALAGWATLAFAQATLKWPILTIIKFYLPRFDSTEPPSTRSTQAVSNSEAHRDLLSGFAGLAGIFQAEAGLVLGRIVFGWANVPVAGLLLALLGLAGAALGLAIWVRASGLLPSWVRRQQLILAQALAVLAVFGLHELGLSWPGILCVLYTENLLVALLLSGRDENGLLHIQTYLLVLQAAVLPLLVRYTSLGALSPQLRALLLVGAALLTLGYQARRRYWRRAQDDFASLSLGMSSSLPLLGLAVGWLLLGAGSLVYAQPWAAWPAVVLLAMLLYLRQRLGLPGLWAGLMIAATGYVALQWGHVLHPLASRQHTFGAGHVLLYLLPTLAVPVAGLLTSWWPAGERYVRWPWLYMLSAHLVIALVAAVPTGHAAYLLLGLLPMGTLAFGAALAWRRMLPDEAAVLRAGQPDRYLLHLGYAGLAASVLLHIYLVVKPELLLSISADYLTAGLLVAVLAALALARLPATEPVYASWRRLHPVLAEVALLVGSGTLAHNLRAQWLPLVWVGTAFVLGAAMPWLAPRFRRLGIYGRLYFWLAALTASADCVLYLTPSHLLSAEWWGLLAAVSLLFGYVGLALRQGNAPFTMLSPAWQVLALPGRRQLEAWLLYPAFLALALLLIQSFDRSVLTVLLMLQVVAVFSTSLLLRRQDLRYVSLIGLMACMGRLVFFDLKQSGNITRAIVFILMGLLLLGMNALYARFKTRFADPNAPTEPSDETEADDESEEPQVAH